jgi:hypothetical protein
VSGGQVFQAYKQKRRNVISLHNILIGHNYTEEIENIQYSKTITTIKSVFQSLNLHFLSITKTTNLFKDTLHRQRDNQKL